MMYCIVRFIVEAIVIVRWEADHFLKSVIFVCFQHLLAIGKNALSTNGYVGTVSKIICLIWGPQPMDRGSNNQHDEHEFLDNNKEIWDDDKGILVEVGRVISLVLG